MVSGDELAGVINVTPNYIDQLVRNGNLPKVARGKFPLIKAVQAYIMRLQERSGKTVVSKQETELELMEERRRRLRMENDLTERKLITMEDAVSAFAEFMGLTDAAFDAFADRVDAECAPSVDVIQSIEAHSQGAIDALWQRWGELVGPENVVRNEKRPVEHRS